MVEMLLFRLQQCFCPFIMLLLKGLMKGDFLDIYLTTYLRVCKFKNTAATRVIFFLENVEN